MTEIKEEKVEKKLYNEPKFLYGCRVEVCWTELFPSEDDDAVQAEFYIWETWVVIDCVQYSNDDEPQYCVMLDENLWTQYSDQQSKCVWLSEKYLDYEDWYEDIFDDFKEDFKCNKDECVCHENLTKEEIREWIKSTAVEIIVENSCKTSVLLAKEMLLLLREAEAYEKLDL